MKSPRHKRRRKNSLSLRRLFSFANRERQPYRKQSNGLARPKLEALESRIVLTTATLSIFVDGDQVSIPEDIGIDAFDARASQVITIDADGTLDIDPIADELLEDVTVGDFFNTWRTQASGAVGGNNADAIFDSQQLLDNRADADNSVQMFVNGQVNRDFEGYVIQEGDEIVLTYGDNPIVSFNTNFGSILLELFEDEAPNTVINFLNYINDGDFDNTIFHRSVTNFVIQGGGFTSSTGATVNPATELERTPTDPPVQNEFMGTSNARGTISMAKTSDPNSATNQFFVNLSNNTSLDSTNNSGGFTVFGQVLGLDTVDEIAAIPTQAVDIFPTDVPVDNGTLVVIEETVGIGAVSGFKFDDANENGQFDDGDSPLAGETIFVDANVNGELDVDEISTTTAADGSYFLELESGAYVLQSTTTPMFVVSSPTVFVEIGREQTDVNLGQRPADIDATDDRLAAINDRTTTSLNVLLNDVVPVGSTIISVTQGSDGGTVEINGDRIDYSPTADFSGEKTFTYTIEDPDGATDTATVIVDVRDVPIGSVTGQIFLDRDENGEQADDEVGVPGVEVRLSGTSDESVEVELTTITANDGSYTFEDVPDGTYTLTRTDSNAVEAIEASPDADSSSNETMVVVTGAEAATPDDTFSSSNLRADFTSIIWFFASSNEPQQIFRDVMATGEDAAGNESLADAIRSDDGTVNPVEDPSEDPNLATADDTFTVEEDTTLTVSAADGLLANDTTSRDDVTVEVTDSTTNGVLVVSDDGSFTYTPNSDFNGTETFTYEVTSGSSTSSANVVINVTAAAEVLTAVNDSFDLNEDQTLTRTAAGSVLSNDINPGGGDLIATVVEDVRGGDLTFNDDGSFVYVPNPDFAGTDDFAYEITDSNGATDRATVTLEVRPVNDPPVANDASFTTTENERLAVDALMGLLAGASDTEDDTLDALLHSPPSDGIVNVARDGSFTYEPDTDFVGTDSFDFVANDGSDDSAAATVTITVEAEDVPSTITFPAEFSNPAVPAIRNVGDTISFDVDVEDPDDDTSTLTYLLDLEDSNIDPTSTQPILNASTGAFEWTPSDSGSFDIRVIVINADGEANAETFALNIL